MSTVADQLEDAAKSFACGDDASVDLIITAARQLRKLESILRGDVPEAPEIGPLSWLKSAIDELRERKPAESDPDPQAYWEMVNELASFHARATALLAELS